MKSRVTIFIVVAIVFLLSLNSLSIWESLSICLFVYFFLNFLDNLGKKIVILDLSLILGSLTCLVMPVIFYHNFTRANSLARLWNKFMPVTSDSYFSFMVPALIAMAIGVRIRLSKSQASVHPKIYIDNAKKILATKPDIGLIITGIGVVSGLLDFLSPDSFRQFFYLVDHLTFVGVFYVIYSPGKNKRIVVPIVITLMFGQSLVTGMFGELINILACALVLITLGKAMPFGKKVGVAILGMFLVLVVQSVKTDYRQRSWMEGSGADPIYYAQLVSDRVTDPGTMFEGDRMFFASVRLNQGWLVGMTMYRVPTRFDFANGETIWQAVAASVIPRVLWPDKPEAGGKANLKRFWGLNLVGYSMNIGPFGEAYANFDRTGGVIYMFFYGLFFNFVLVVLLNMARKRPTIVLWIPFLFFRAINVETDLLSTMGALMTSITFTWITFKVFSIAFRIDL